MFAPDQSGPPSSDIYVINLDSSGLRRLTTDEAPKWGTAWSPDGATIAFQRGDGPAAIYLMDADGENEQPIPSAGDNFHVS